MPITEVMNLSTGFQLFLWTGTFFLLLFLRQVAVGTSTCLLQAIVGTMDAKMTSFLPPP